MALAEKIITRTARILEQSATTTIVMDGYRYDIGKDFLLIRGKGLKQPTLIRAGERYEVLFQPVTSGREMEKNGPRLLTGNTRDINVYANEIITIGSNLRTRSEVELPDLIKIAEKLISFLKTEYHLK